MERTRVSWTTIPGPRGAVHLAVAAGVGDDPGAPPALVAVELMSPTEAFLDGLTRRLRASPLPGERADPVLRHLLADAADGLADLLSGRRRSLDLPLALTGISAWDRAVLGGVATIGWGEVTSYGRLARLIGRPGAARAAGGAVGRNPLGLVIPCHRVIAGDGSIGGYGGGWWGPREELLDLKRELLAREGVTLPARELVG